MSTSALDPTIFRAYDIRGIAGENLSEDVVHRIGTAFAAEALAASCPGVAIGGDGRRSTPALVDALAEGLVAGGVDVVDIGTVPTPLLYYATHEIGTGAGIMLTGSHNPPEYNGLKMVLGGATLAGEGIERLRLKLDATPNATLRKGERKRADMLPSYLERVRADVTLSRSARARPLKVVVDCGNGVAGLVAPQLLTALGCEVTTLYGEVDASFPNHHPDPAEPANLRDLREAVIASRADVGLAFDGDGDRLGVVTSAGKIVWPDTLLMLFIRAIAAEHPGARIVHDVKCSRHVARVAEAAGAEAILCPTGHSHIKARIRETGALVGGEFSGHICFADRWYGFDDAIYAAARTLELLAASEESSDEVFAALPRGASTPEIKIATTDERKFEIVKALGRASLGCGTITAIDGIRVDHDDGFGLVRASNTGPVLSLRFEADNADALERIQQTFQRELLAVDPTLRFLPASASEHGS